ncbi:aldo/keto reductase [Companilactobacillus farciminis]|nr:aldo/keto reductase [Companilactobacillus farciminis]
MNLMQEDLKMPKIALGTWAWGESKSANKVFGNSLTANDLEPIFNKGMELGLNLWDTAAVYNDGDSEAILGKFVKGIDRDKVILSTKLLHRSLMIVIKPLKTCLMAVPIV